MWGLLMCTREENNGRNGFKCSYADHANAMLMVNQFVMIVSVYYTMYMHHYYT